MAAVDQLQLVTPLPGLAAVDVPHLVELSPVEIDKGTLARPNCRQRRIHPSVKGMRRFEATAAQGRRGQPRAVEEARADAGDGHARCDGPFEQGLARLPQTRIRAVVPGQLVEQPVLAGDEHLVADQSVGAGGQARPERAHARRGGRRETCAEPVCRGQQPSHERRVPAALAQQVIPQPVDEHHHGPPRRRQVERVERPFLLSHPQGPHHRRQDAGQPGRVVRGQQALVKHLTRPQRPMAADSARANAMAWASAGSPSASALIRSPMSSVVTVPS